jgi:hypothetical protein
MTKQQIQSAIEFLQKVFVGPADQERLFNTIEALKQELARRNKK